MLRCALFLTVFMALASRAAGADHPPPRSPQAPPPVILVIPANSAINPDAPLAFGTMLQQSLANHLEHFLAASGLAAVVKLSAAPLSDEGALASLEKISDQEALLVYYSAERHDESYVARDRHRRRYHARAENCLRLDLQYRRYRWSSGGWVESGRGSITAQGEPTRLAVRTGSGAVYCEPHELVIQRALNALIPDLPAMSVSPPQSGATLPVRIFLSGPLAHYRTQHQGQLHQMVTFASGWFAAQFGVRLELAAIDTLPHRFDGRQGLQENQADFDEFYAASGDTLILVLNRLLHPDMYTVGERQEGIGLSRLGRRRIYMDLLPSASPDDTLWPAVANGLTFLHELGHVLGGIHVSDIGSIMNHRANWVNTAAFDPLNRKLIAAALDGTLRFDDPVEYVRFFTRALLSTPYYLADYPAFLSDYLDWGGNRRMAERLRSALGDASVLYAADGVRMLNHGSHTLAAQMLRAAIRANPQQASLYYYLSLAVDRRSAPALRAAARQRGYLMATEP